MPLSTSPNRGLSVGVESVPLRVEPTSRRGGTDPCVGTTLVDAESVGGVTGGR